MKTRMKAQPSPEQSKQAPRHRRKAPRNLKQTDSPRPSHTGFKEREYFTLGGGATSQLSRWGGFHPDTGWFRESSTRDLGLLPRGPLVGIGPVLMLMLSGVAPDSAFFKLSVPRLFFYGSPLKPRARAGLGSPPATGRRRRASAPPASRARSAPNNMT